MVGEGESGQSAGDVEGDDEAGVHLLQGTGWRVGTGHRAQGTEHERWAQRRIADRQSAYREFRGLFGNGTLLVGIS